MPNLPAWKDDFPISWVDDHFVTRREFTTSLVFVSFAAFTANGVLMTREILERQHEAAELPALKIITLDELAVGATKVFHYPAAEDPCLLVRMDKDRYAAFGQKCTHLGCPVIYQAQNQRLCCPCHKGFFSAADGRVLAGPPTRPLPLIQLERRGNELWAIGKSL